MHWRIRRGFIGLAAGAVGSAALLTVFDTWVLAVIFGAGLGIAYGLIFPPTRRAYADNAMTAAAFGFPVWTLINVIAMPLFAYRPPNWTAAGMQALLPQLVAWVIFGAGLGLDNARQQYHRTSVHPDARRSSG